MLNKTGQVIALNLLDEAALCGLLAETRKDAEGYEKYLRWGQPGQVKHEIAAVRLHDAQKAIEEIEAELRNRSHPTP